jgi:ribosomal protein S18 acetylase RimI-like enzyme
VKVQSIKRGGNEMTENVVIHRIRDELGLQESLRVIHDSFITVANDLSLTPGNAPTNPAFLAFEKLKEAVSKGVLFFGLFANARQAGLVAVEQAGDTTYYMERLAVLPEFRHQGFGVKLMDFVFEYVKNCGGHKVSIAVIDENQVLKQWYLKYGFRLTEVKRYPHLPFTVCFMEKLIGKD